MTPEDELKFKEYIFLAVQSGKQETSGLVTDIIDRIENKLESTIAASIEKNVNGKIRAIDRKIDDYIKSDTEYNQRIDEETAGWRKGADQKLAIVASVEGFGKVSAYILGIITTVGAATVFIIKLLEWIKK